jgi:shikimate kinase
MKEVKMICNYILKELEDMKKLFNEKAVIAKCYEKCNNTNIQEVKRNVSTKMVTIYKKVIEGSWFKGMRYANLVYKNRILII